ncbi:P-loop ATPase, Sll1717 family [Pseudomonas syringae]|uniref:P-loop ATPase, Sll1717 family n=1 Tax=Pseudomonas syringae TaxID=317 RepID=UPI002FD9996F
MTQEWIKISDLKEPMNDAYNYKGKHHKEFFTKIFLPTEELKKCLEPDVYFIIGEKGSGKTAYAVYLENNPDKSHVSKLTSMTETQYKRFITLKKENKLNYSDYANVWRSMLLFVTSQMIIEKSKKALHTLTGKFKQLDTQIAKWTKNALNPEIETAFDALSEMVFSGEAGATGIKLSGSNKNAETEKSQILKHHLLNLEQSFKEALQDLSLSKSHTIFIDGIDYRPEQIGYREYLECIKGLGEAVWQLNTDFFSGIKDSKGRIKICLLVRPDVLNSLNLYNSNSRIQDNSVLLNWSTTEKDLKSADLYNLCDKFLGGQQVPKAEAGLSWEHYFANPSEPNRTFKYLLKTTFQKPRDFLTFIKICRSIEMKSGKGSNLSFSPQTINTPNFSKQFSDYLLGEVRNYSAFYMTPADFSKYIKFFQFLDGKGKLTTPLFVEAFNAYKRWADGEEFDAPKYQKDAETLLQLFFDMNVIGYQETTSTGNETFYHWAFKERTLNNIAPAVKFGADLLLNPGISKALDVGSHFKTVEVVSDRKPTRKRRRAHHRKTSKSE